MNTERNNSTSPPAAGDAADVANQSLANALRMSFRLLSGIMIAVVVALLLTGFRQVDSGERAVRLLFGRILGQGDDRVLDEGVKWSWPEPAGQVVKVATKAQTLEIQDFWMAESAAEAETLRSERRVRSQALDPIRDGALLTADRALIHCKFECKYRLGVNKKGEPDARAVLDYLQNVQDPEELIRSAVANAAIRAAAERTAEAIITVEQEQFQADITKLTQERLDQLNSGVKIEAVVLRDKTVPIAAVAASNAVASARQERQEMVNNAKRDAATMLWAAAGDSWKPLVQGEEGKKGLLRQYYIARNKEDAAGAAKVLTEIDDVLMSSQTKGRAAEILNVAARYSSTIRTDMETQAKGFQKLLNAYNDTPELLLATLWGKVKYDILSGPTNVKYYITPGEKMILRINEDPEIRQRIEERKLRTAEQAKRRAEMLRSGGPRR